MPYYLIFKGGVGNLEGVIIRDKTLAKAKIRAKKFFPEYRHILPVNLDKVKLIK